MTEDDFQELKRAIGGSNEFEPEKVKRLLREFELRGLCYYCERKIDDVKSWLKGYCKSCAHREPKMPW